MPSRSFTVDRVAAFRLARHHLTGGSTAPLVEVCRDVGGIQAQVMSAAELSLWTRRRQTTRADVKAALWTRRDLVKTTSMRRTLHLLPSRDFQMYIAAMRAWSMSQTSNLLRRIGASGKHVDTMIDVVMDALADGPKTQQDLLARARTKASKGMRVWLQYTWSAMRPAILQGLIVYGEPRGAEATFVRVDQWLPKQKAIDPERRRRAQRRAPARPRPARSGQAHLVADAAAVVRHFSARAGPHRRRLVSRGAREVVHSGREAVLAARREKPAGGSHRKPTPSASSSASAATSHSQRSTSLGNLI